MATHSYTNVGNGIPAIPILPLQLSGPVQSDLLTLTVPGILDTGSDCTLVPISLLQRIKGRVVDRAIKIPACGQVMTAIPYAIGLTFDHHVLSALIVFGCADDGLDGYVIVGRDVMNGYRIEFNGMEKSFTIF
jgi:hypothetical protein